jgi:peroxiredoxin
MEPTREIEPFSLPASTGQTLSLHSFKGKVPLVLVFLADIDAEEDLALLDELDSRLREFGSERSQVLAVARATARDARALAEKRDLSIAVLADASGAMARNYEADDEKGGTRRVAVVASKSGEMKRRFDPLSLEGDPEAIVDGLLDTVRALGTGALTGPAEDE